MPSEKGRRPNELVKSGPERPLLIERWTEILPLPYFLGVAVWTLVFYLVIPYVAAYVDTSSLSASASWVLINTCNNPCTVDQARGPFISEMLFYLVPALLARRIRLSILRARPVASTGREGHFDSAFRLTSSWIPQVALAVAVLVVFISFPSGGSSEPGPVSGTIAFLGFLYLLLGMGSLIWAYTAGLWGVHQFGKSLELLSPSSDRSQGTGAVGHVSTSLALSYFVLVGVALISGLVSSFDTAGILIIGSLTVLGIVMFFLPVYSLHQRMDRNKETEVGHLQRDMVGLAQEAAFPTKTTAEQSSRAERLNGLEILHRTASSARTWPFDTGAVEKVSAIGLSIVVVLLTRVIVTFLHI